MGLGKDVMSFEPLGVTYMSHIHSPAGYQESWGAAEEAVNLLKVSLMRRDEDSFG
jgi:hypothetical protein